MSTITVDVEIDLGDVIMALSDSDIEKIAKLHEDEKEDADDPVLAESMLAISQNRYDDALLMLERNAYPKWDSVAECRGAYNAAMAAR